MSISGAAKLAGIMGWPVAHSRSPALHGYWLERYGIDGAYVPMAVKPENLRRSLQALPLLGFAGCNLTIPHKEEALRAVDDLEPSAKRAGGVNTVVINARGQLIGSSTDGYGFIAALRVEAPAFDPSRAPAVVLGAGGAARARGNRCVDGLGMLLHQAAPGFEAWFGVKPAIDSGLREAVLATLHKI